MGEKDASKAGARFVLDRMLPNLWSVGFIAMSLPDACILHVVRGQSCWAATATTTATTPPCCGMGGRCSEASLL